MDFLKHMLLMPETLPNTLVCGVPIIILFGIILIILWFAKIKWNVERIILFVLIFLVSYFVIGFSIWLEIATRMTAQSLGL